jgi:hypothetical protein
MPTELTKGLCKLPPLITDFLNQEVVVITYKIEEATTVLYWSIV